MSRAVIYKKIADYLRSAIAEGELKVGDAVYSENLLCEKFKVSRTSVRKAIRQMVDENLLVSRQGLGTFVKTNGHGLIHNAVCLINHWNRILRFDYTDTYYMDMVYGAEEEINSRQINFQLFSSRISSTDDVKKFMSHIKVDGILLDGEYPPESSALFINRLSPHVVILDGNPAESTLPTVAPDAEPAFRELLKLASARDGLIFYLHEEHHTLNRWRLKCFNKAVKTAKLKNVVLVNYMHSVSADNFQNIDHYFLIAKALNEAMLKHPGCRTIIADGDHAAVKAMNFLKRKNYAIPADIAVSGFSGMNISTLTEPALTTVHIDSNNMAAMAADFLIEHIEGKTQDKTRLLPINLMKRESL